MTSFSELLNLFLSTIFFFVYERRSRKTKKKKNDREHSRIQCNNLIKRLFIVILIKYCSVNCFLLVHYRNKCDSLFLLMKNSFEKSTQVHCDQSSRSEIFQRDDYEI